MRWLWGALGAGNYFFGNGKEGDDAKTTKIDISGLSGATSLKVSDEVVLLHSGSDIDSSIRKFPQITTARAGSTLNYTFDMQAGKSGDKDITARVTHIEVRPEAKALAEGYLSGMAFLGQGSDFLLSQGMSAAQDASNDAIDGSQGFAAVGYGNVHRQTGSSVSNSIKSTRNACSWGCDTSTPWTAAFKPTPASRMTGNTTAKRK
jgi:hypothetical protein